MRTRLIALSAVLTLAVAGAAGAATVKTTPKKRSISTTFKVATLDTSGNTITAAGEASDKLAGKGAVLETSTGTATEQTTKTTFFFAKGTVRGTSKVTITSNPDGSITFQGTGDITGGTGAYHGIKGKNFKITGGTAPNSTVITGKVVGTVTY